MDIQQLTQEQIDLTLRLSDVLEMADLTVAAAVLASFDWNIQKALRELQNEPAPAQKTAIPPQAENRPSQQEGAPIDPNIYSYDYEENEDYGYGEENNYQYENNLMDEKKKYFQQQHASLFQLKKTLSQPGTELNRLQYHKLLAKDTKAHREDYFLNLMNKSEVICKRIIESNPQNKKRYNENKQKVENNRKFINNLYTTYHPEINFTFGTFFLNLTRAYLQGKYLLVYIHSIAPQTQLKFKGILELVLKQKRIASVVNKNCITYGMFDNSDDYQIIQKYIPLKNLPAFGLFKLSKTKKSEQFISSYNLSQKQPFLEWLASNMGIALMQNEEHGEHIQKQRQLKDEYEQKMIQKQKQAQVAQLKKVQQQHYKAFANQKSEQDYQYALLEKNYYQKKQLSADERQKQNLIEQNYQRRVEEAQKQIQPEDGQNVIEVRFRMPDTGQSKARRFLLTQKVEKAFTFIDCFCREQFEQKHSDFQLMQTHPTLILRNFKDKTFQELFDGSRRQNVIVRQR